MHDLPGTDPRFHESRNYLTPVVLRGEEILAAHGSCKEQGCDYRSAWTTNAARDRGMWLHRALKVREARMAYFRERFPDPNDMRPLRLQKETADINSHYFKVWAHHVLTFFRELVGDEAVAPPNYDYYADYKLGNMALDTAKFLVDGR